ncbi:hypothetical protein BKA70DRAFT_1461581, partial [Coprinopsis sp. MPI-PUGE-AT-0042]
CQTANVNLSSSAIPPTSSPSLALDPFLAYSTTPSALPCTPLLSDSLMIPTAPSLRNISPTSFASASSLIKARYPTTSPPTSSATWSSSITIPRPSLDFPPIIHSPTRSSLMPAVASPLKMSDSITNRAASDPRSKSVPFPFTETRRLQALFIAFSFSPPTRTKSSSDNSSAVVLTAITMKTIRALVLLAPLPPCMLLDWSVLLRRPGGCM